jgi:hypothetical protein
MKSEKWRIERQADECMDGWMDLQRGKGRERWIARQQDPRDRCRHDRMEGWIEKETDRGGERKGDGGRGQRERERERESSGTSKNKVYSQSAFEAFRQTASLSPHTCLALIVRDVCHYDSVYTCVFWVGDSRL